MSKRKISSYKVSNSLTQADRIDKLLKTFEQIIQEANKTIDSTRNRYRQLTNLSRTKLLIFDDIEYNKDNKEHRERMAQFSEDASDFLYTLIQKRYESTTAGATIFTFNEAFIGWDRIFGSEARAEKLIDRILDHTRRCIVKIEGDSYRSKGALVASL